MTIGHKLFGRGKEGVIVLHGWLSDHTVFEPMLPALDAAAFTYAFIDHRGYGLSRATSGEYSLSEIAQDAIALADELGWNRFHVVGHSMGGAVAQRLCIAAPNRVKSCVCVTPVPVSGVPMSDDERALFTGATADDDKRRAIVDHSTGARLPRPWLDQLVASSRRAAADEAFSAYFHAWSAGGGVEQAAGLETPMLVVVGAEDRALTAEVMQATFMTLYPNAILKVIANAGHYPMQETPIYFAGLIEDFMHRHAEA